MEIALMKHVPKSHEALIVFYNILLSVIKCRFYTKLRAIFNLKSTINENYEISNSLSFIIVQRCHYGVKLFCKSIR